MQLFIPKRTWSIRYLLYLFLVTTFPFLECPTLKQIHKMQQNTNVDGDTSHDECFMGSCTKHTAH